MDMIKISSCLTNQHPVALFPILDDASVKLTLFQPSTVVLHNYYIDQLTNYLISCLLVNLVNALRDINKLSREPMP
jgi:hypothetical protein